MELNGMCLIWGWQSTNCFLFELLPAWLGTAVIETIMFHSSLAIIYLKSSFTTILFYSPSWNLSLYHYPDVRGCILSVHPDFYLAWVRHFKHISNLSVHGPAPFVSLALATGLAAPQVTGLLFLSLRSLLYLWLRTQVSTSLWDSSHFPSKPRVCSGFETILFCVTPDYWLQVSDLPVTINGEVIFFRLCLVLLLYVVLTHYTEVAVAVVVLGIC